MQDGLRKRLSPPHQASKNTRMEGVRMAPRKGAGELQNRHVAGHRCGFEAGHAVISRTAQEWGVGV